jgi:hypothetical protein
VTRDSGTRRGPNLRRALALLLATLASGCVRVETRQPLPWFRTRIQHSPTIGGLASGGASGLPPQVRRFGLFWKELEGCLGGEVLGPDTVAVSCSDTFHSGAALLRRGETVPTPACGAYSSNSLVLPDRSAVECSTMLAGKAPIVPTKIRYWRVAPTRAVLQDVTLAIEEPGRAFVGPLPRFYDDRLRGYFLSATEDWAAAPGCVLLTVEAGQLVPVARGPELSRAQCSEPAIWSEKSGRTQKTSTGESLVPVAEPQ